MPRIESQETSNGVHFHHRKKIQTSTGSFSDLGELTSVCDDYAEPHDLIRRASLPRRGDRALYCGKKEIDHEDCEDDSNRLVLPFRPGRRVSEKAIFVGRDGAYDRGLLPMEKRKEAMTMEAKRYYSEDIH